MTAFNKDSFYIGGGYVNYGLERRFVARFKYRAGDARSFIAFLIKNFTVEEYFARMDADEAPLKILESKGYLLPHIKRWLKERGLPQTIAGRDEMIRQNAARAAQRQLD